jgi:hypothetical protein
MRPDDRFVEVPRRRIISVLPLPDHLIRSSRMAMLAIITASKESSGAAWLQFNSFGSIKMSTTTQSRARLGAIILVSMAAGGLIGHSASAGQPHMVNALTFLQRADNQLQMALPDHAGYREQAISLTEQAISAVNAGIAAAD